MTPRSRGILEARALAVLALCAWLAPVAVATTLEVDDSGGAPFSTIQSAIDAANPFADDVFVHCGLYNENITMRDGVSVSGAGADCTTIDGGGSGSVVTINDVGSATVLEGFRIRNGSAARGGGIFLEASSMTIRDNIIENNSAVFGGSPPTGQGGGIHISTDITLRAFTEPVITRNVIRNNSADTLGGGIAIYLGEGSTIHNNVIDHNTAVTAGGGIHAFASFPDVVNNTIVRNCLQGAGTACSGGGGGIALTDSAVVDVANNVIAWNEAGARAGGVDVSGSSTVVFDSNDTYANTPANYFGVTDPTGSSGNIALDPLLVDEQPTRSGYQPRSDSPLVDAGSATLAPALDLRGIGRPLDGDGSGAAQYDIGARENEGITRLLFSSRDDLAWDPSVDTLATFNLYRGNLAALRASCASACVYIQDPAVVTDAAQWCNLASPARQDTAQPPAGTVWFYLPVVQGASAEASLGFDGTPAERPFTAANSCP